jgi:hypothetical protein
MVTRALACDPNNRRHAAPTTPTNTTGNVKRSFDVIRLLSKACGLSAILADLMR